MSLDITQNTSIISNIRDCFSCDEDIVMYRHTYILSGNESWQKEFLQKLVSGSEDDVLWVSDNNPEIFPFIEIKKARDWLGNEKRIVIFDANSDFNPDSFAAITGIVVGGGLFFLLLPAKEEWNNVYSSYFGQRLLQSISSSPELTFISQYDETVAITCNQPELNISKKYSFPFLSNDQQCAVESIETQVLNNTNIPVVLTSDRGRGKSAALGLIAAKLLISGVKKIIITAPSLRATNIIYKHIYEMLPIAEITRGKVTYGESIIQFYSPDRLIQEDINADLLLVDEAAAIPVPILTSFLHSYSQCVFSTTVHGYEGTGRGFSLRFFKELDKHNSKWIKLLMKTPIRWAENDPLEKWMFDLLCLDAELTDIASLGEVGNVEHKLIPKYILFNNEELLNEVFSLLVLAHYRTRPKDLVSLLDDENISLYITLKNKHVIAVALVVQEGSFSSELSTFVYRGERRPQGHLLAQSLTYHCGIENAATLNYARVMRIAVHPDLQNQGIGSTLLDFIIENESELGRDAVGTSFGMTKRLLSFWEKSDFNIVRIGFTREKTSGEHAAVMLLGLSLAGKDIFQKAQSRFNEQIPYWVKDILKDIPPEVKVLLEKEVKLPLELSIIDRKDIESYVCFSRNYELCIAALSKLVIINYSKVIRENMSEKSCCILQAKVVDKKSWQEIRFLMELSGKSEACKLFNNAIKELLTCI